MTVGEQVSEPGSEVLVRGCADGADPEAVGSAPPAPLVRPAFPVPIDPLEAITALASRLASQGVTVDARETRPSWWGERVDYSWEIDWLRWRDGKDLASAAG